MSNSTNNSTSLHNPTTAGAAVGALTAVQAAAFVAACELFAAGRLQLVYADDGRPAVVATRGEAVEGK